VDIRAQLPQDASRRSRRVMWRGHLFPSRFQEQVYVARSLQSETLPGKGKGIHTLKGVHF
jgi:hypothetical protein